MAVKLALPSRRTRFPLRAPGYAKLREIKRLAIGDRSMSLPKR